MRTLIAIGLTSLLLLSLPTSSANAGGGGGGGHGLGSINNPQARIKGTCNELVRAKYCGGQQCSPGSQAQAQARAHWAICVQNGGKL
jgi:hypothetical protein